MTHLFPPLGRRATGYVFVFLIFSGWTACMNNAASDSKASPTEAEDIAPAPPPVTKSVSPTESSANNHKIAYSALALSFYKALTPERLSALAGSGETLRAKAGRAAVQHKYAMAADMLAQEAVVKNDDAARLLRAHARFASGQFGQAAADFKLLEKKVQYQNECQWHYLLCLVAQGKGTEAEAQQLLKRFIADERFPYQEKAVQINTQL
jgi:hypothetical protein